MTSRHVALLKGVNVGTARRIQMADLRRVLSGQGFSDVETYIQSGNVIFSSGEQEETRLASDIEAALQAAFGIPVQVIIRTSDEMSSIMAHNPYLADSNILEAAEDSLASLHVAFLADQPDSQLAGKLERSKGPDEGFFLSGKEIYLNLPHGFHAAKLAQAIQRSCPGATFRNWKTVAYLNQMLQGQIRA
jgi:uncharacterized protein (DUF1697 family)